MSLFGIPIFEDVSILGLALLAAVYFFAFIVKGAFGYGAVPLMVVLGSLIVGPHHAVLLAAMANLMTQAQYVPESIRNGDKVLARKLLVYALPAIALGVWVFGRLDAGALSLLIGVLILCMVVAERSDLFKRHEGALRRKTGVLVPFMATLSGLMAGVIGTGGIIFISFYIKMMCPEKVTFRATILFFATFFILWRAVVLGVGGFITPTLLLEALLLMPLLVIAGLIGTKVFAGMKGKTFFLLFQGLLVMSALILIGRGGLALSG